MWLLLPREDLMSMKKFVLMKSLWKSYKCEETWLKNKPGIRPIIFTSKILKIFFFFFQADVVTANF